MVQRNKLYLKPSPSLAAALRRIDAREDAHRARLAEERLAQVERALARGPVTFTVEDAIRD
jgi:hypothetical protein